MVNDTDKLSFSPDEIESLPRQAIYNRVVQCAVCPFTTKVRTNIIRHLLLHKKDESVPESAPVNPVPCLDKKERMFDKMVNLASSSHQNGRMGGKQKESSKTSNDEFIPKFVPEHKRQVTFCLKHIIYYSTNIFVRTEVILVSGKSIISHIAYRLLLQVTLIM